MVQTQKDVVGMTFDSEKVLLPNENNAKKRGRSSKNLLILSETNSNPPSAPVKASTNIPKQKLSYLDKKKQTADTSLDLSYSSVARLGERKSQPQKAQKQSILSHSKAFEGIDSDVESEEDCMEIPKKYKRRFRNKK